VAADQRGDISSALSALERLLDLDRRVPDAVVPERATNYQNLYNNVRFEHESIQRSYAERNTNWRRLISPRPFPFARISWRNTRTTRSFRR